MKRFQYNLPVPGRYNGALLNRRVFLFGSSLALAGCGHKRSSGFNGYAFIANEAGQAVAAVDLTTFTLARHISLDSAPTTVLAPQGKAYVYALTPGNGAVHEIGVADLAHRRRVQTARSAHSMQLSPNGDSIWVLCRQPRELVRLALDTMRVQTRIALPLDPSDFDCSPDGSSAVVAFGETGAFGLVDFARRVCRVFYLHKKLLLARYRFDGRQILLTGADEPVLSIADARSGRTIVHLPLAIRARHLCFKSDGGQLFITGDGTDAVAVVYPYSTEVSETALAGRAPGFMAECRSEDDSDYLLVSNAQSGEVTALDIETRRVIAVVSVGRTPGFITPTPDRQYALVLNQDSGDMAVIRLAAIGETRRGRSAPLFTMVPVGSKPVGAAIRHV